MRTATILMAIFLVSLSLGAGETWGAKFFKWIDREGIVHFSDHPPQEGSQTPGGDVQERVFEDAPAAVDASEDQTAAAPSNPIEYAANSTFAIESSGSYGSGFFISADGYAVTCKHVILQGSDPVAVLKDQERCPIRVISESPDHDLALLLVLVDRRTEPLVLRDANSLKTGERILAIGAPAGLASTVTDGIFTGFRQIEPGGDRLIQFSAPVNPGNSGGPLIDIDGKVVGIVSSKYLGSEKTPLSGLGFALPSFYVLESYQSYISR